jgi:hypothetical protein
MVHSKHSKKPPRSSKRSLKIKSKKIPKKRKLTPKKYIMGGGDDWNVDDWNVDDNAYTAFVSGGTNDNHIFLDHLKLFTTYNDKNIGVVNMASIDDEKKGLKLHITEEYIKIIKKVVGPITQKYFEELKEQNNPTQTVLNPTWKEKIETFHSDLKDLLGEIVITDGDVETIKKNVETIKKNILSKALLIINEPSEESKGESDEQTLIGKKLAEIYKECVGSFERHIEDIPIEDGRLKFIDVLKNSNVIDTLDTLDTPIKFNNKFKEDYLKSIFKYKKDIKKFESSSKSVGLIEAIFSSLNIQPTGGFEAKDKSFFETEVTSLKNWVNTKKIDYLFVIEGPTQVYEGEEPTQVYEGEEKNTAQKYWLFNKIKNTFKDGFKLEYYLDNADIESCEESVLVISRLPNNTDDSVNTGNSSIEISKNSLTDSTGGKYLDYIKLEGLSKRIRIAHAPSKIPEDKIDSPGNFLNKMMEADADFDVLLGDFNITTHKEKHKMNLSQFEDLIEKKLNHVKYSLATSNITDKYYVKKGRVFMNGGLNNQVSKGEKEPKGQSDGMGIFVKNPTKDPTKESTEIPTEILVPSEDNQEIPTDKSTKDPTDKSTKKSTEERVAIEDTIEDTQELQNNDRRIINPEGNPEGNPACGNVLPPPAAIMKGGAITVKKTQKIKTKKKRISKINRKKNAKK